MAHVRVQIAGVSSLEEALYIADQGGDALGFTLRLPSGVHDELTETKAKGIVAALPPFVSAVVITYVDTPQAAIDLCRRVGADTLQLHGSFPDRQIDMIRAGLPHLKVIRAVHVTGPEAIEHASRLQRRVDALILDTFDAPSGRGGATGLTHDWSISRQIVEAVRVPVILAGGLHPGNLAEAIAEVRPWGVDVHTGVEDADGSRNFSKIAEFIRIARG